MKVTTGRGDEGKVAYFHVHAKREKVYYFLPHSRSERESAWRRIFSFRNLFSICFVRVRDATKSVLQLHVERQQVQFFMSCIFSRFRCHLLQLVSLVFVSSKAHDSWWRYWCRLFFCSSLSSWHLRLVRPRWIRLAHHRLVPSPIPTSIPSWLAISVSALWSVTATVASSTESIRQHFRPAPPCCTIRLSASTSMDWAVVAIWILDPLSRYLFINDTFLTC